MVKWTKHEWRASMTDVTEYRADFYDSKKNIPYEATVSINKRDSGVTDYTIVIQGRVAEPIRGWWMVNTYFHKQGTTNSPKTVLDTANKAIAKLGTGLKNITYEEYFDWDKNHPIQKQRRNPTDWGIYAYAPDGVNGWLDMVYGTLLPRNGYASRWDTQAEAKAMATKLTKANPGWKFEVMQMGRVEYQHR